MSAPHQTSRRPRAIVVGATFGAVYAGALATPDSPVELVGLLTHGSAASAALAELLGVPLYTGFDSLPRIDLAFVVVRSGVVGGDGTRICEQLLARGVHVMQEQPVHADEIVALLRVAKANSALYVVNDFYSRVAPVRQFVRAANRLGAIAPIRYVHARSSIHVAYPLFTILAALVGPLTPARIQVLSHDSERSAGCGGPFVAGRLLLGDVAVDLLIQNELCAADPDNHARLMHTITVGSEAGELILAHTHGPTRWHRRLHLAAGTTAAQIAEPVGADFDPTAEQIRSQLWPNAVRLAAAEFVESIANNHPMITQRFVRATRLWSDFTSAAGPATLIDPLPIQQISAPDLLARCDQA